MTEEQMVGEFITAFEAKPDWNVLVIEESKEVIEAVDHLLKEIVDLAYVLTGLEVSGQLEYVTDNPYFSTAIKWAVDIGDVLGEDRLNEAFARVHASNMSKLDDNGKPIRREDGKIMKGQNYKPPVLRDLIERV